MLKKIKYLLSTIIVCLVISCNCNFASSIKVNTKVLNVRENASINSNKVTVVKLNEVYEIFNKNEDWVKILVNGQYGWVNIKYVIINSEENNDNNIKIEKIVTANILNIRQSSNIKSKILGQLKKDSIVEVVETIGLWDKIVFNEKEAWVSNEYLQIYEKRDMDLVTSRGDYIRDELSVRDKVVNEAKSFVGGKYIWGGTTKEGFDCSGMVYYIYKQYIDGFPRSCESQAEMGEEVKKEDLQPGDIVFFQRYGNGVLSHVGIYIGNEEFIHASSSKVGIVKSSISSNYYKENYLYARRVF